MEELTCAEWWLLLKSGAVLGLCGGEMFCVILFKKKIFYYLDGYFFFQTNGFFSAMVCLNPRVSGQIFITRQGGSPGRVFVSLAGQGLSPSPTDPFMLVLLTIEGDPEVTCYKSLFTCILNGFAQKKVFTDCYLHW